MKVAVVTLVFLLAVTAGVVAAVFAPWRGSRDTAGELEVTQASLHPGRIALVVVNSGEEAARVAQVILDDAFVDFRASRLTLAPGGAETITVSYPWIRGEAYDIELLTSTGRTVGYEIEEAA